MRRGLYKITYELWTQSKGGGGGTGQVFVKDCVADYAEDAIEKIREAARLATSDGRPHEVRIKSAEFLQTVVSYTILDKYLDKYRRNK